MWAVASSGNEVPDMRIKNQFAGRDIRSYEINYKITAARMNPELRRRLEEIETVLRDAVGSGALDDGAAAELEAAAQEVAAAATDPTPRPSRLQRALEVLKTLSAAAGSTAGLAEAVDKIVHSVTGS
jgi:hypothetical protein